MRVPYNNSWENVEVGETWHIKDVVGAYVVEAKIVSCTDKTVVLAVDGDEARREWNDIKFIEKVENTK